MDKGGLNMDADTIKALKEVFQPQQQDSFSVFTGGINKGWPFITALALIGFWVFQNLNQVQTINLTQDQRIDSNTKNIQSLTETIASFNTNVTSKFDQQNTSNNEIIRRLDSLQTAVQNLTPSK